MLNVFSALLGSLGCSFPKKVMPMPGYSRNHNGRVSVDESKQRWCSDGLGFKCFNGKTVSMTFVLGCRDREAIFLSQKRENDYQPGWHKNRCFWLSINALVPSVLYLANFNF